MRKLIKLVIFFSLSFAILLLISTGLRFLVLRVEWVRMLSLEQEAILVELLSAARWALSLVLYGGVLFGLSYAVRKKVFSPLAILLIIGMTVVFICGLDGLLQNWENVPAAKTSIKPLGGPGLILANPVRPAGTVLVLLEGPEKPGGSRVVAEPEKPMLYQEEFVGRDLNSINLPPAPFIDNTAWFMKSLAIDLNLNSIKIRKLLNEGIIPFVIYIGALVFFLCSLMFILKLSAWPLANLVLGCLAFRGVLALEIFLNTPEMQLNLESFLGDRLPVSFAVPIIFCVVGLLAYLYTFLVFLARRQGDYEY